MQKPITVILNKFKQSLLDAVNGSGLPFFIMEPYIKDLWESVRDGAERQAENDWAAYEEYLQEQKESGGETAEAQAAAGLTQEAADGDGADGAPSETEG